MSCKVFAECFDVAKKRNSRARVQLRQGSSRFLRARCLRDALGFTERSGHVIDSDADSVTLINTFIVRPENQDELLDVLDDATKHTLRNQPGFIGASIQRGVDGKRVVSYSQWRSRADVEAIQKDPAWRERIARAAGLSERFEPALYEVSSVHERWPNASLPYSPDIFVSL